MRKMQQILVGSVLVLSASSVMAAMVTKESAIVGFHALSQVTSVGTKAVAELSDQKLDGVIGGYLLPDQNPNDFPSWVLPYVRTKGSKSYEGSSGGPWVSEWGSVGAGISLPNPLDPYRPWGPLGPCVKRVSSLKNDGIRSVEPTPPVNDRQAFYADPNPQPNKVRYRNVLSRDAGHYSATETGNPNVVGGANLIKGLGFGH